MASARPRAIAHSSHRPAGASAWRAGAKRGWPWAWRVETVCSTVSLGSLRGEAPRNGCGELGVVGRGEVEDERSDRCESGIVRVGIAAGVLLMTDARAAEP